MAHGVVGKINYITVYNNKKTRAPTDFKILDALEGFDRNQSLA